MSPIQFQAKVIDEVAGLIAGTLLDTTAYREKLSKLTPNDQVVVAKRDLSAQRRKANDLAPVPATKPMPGSDIRSISLATIKLDQRAQPRDHLNTEKTGEYAEAMVAGDKFPPMVVFHDGTDYWLADGFHRHYAALGAKLKEFPCEVRPGGLRDAILYSVGANATHGYPRTNADKRRAVQRLFDDEEWSSWTDREIARRCAVSNRFVTTMRPIVPVTVNGTQSEPTPTRTYVHPKTGKPTQMNTSAINRDRPRAAAADPAPALPAQAETRSDEAQAEIDRRHANGYISTNIWAIERAFALLPTPDVAASNFPDWHVHTFSSAKARALRDWFDAFAKEFEKIEGAPGVEAT